jgi:ATP-dependent DNA helicase HFM1/MER3
MEVSVASDGGKSPVEIELSIECGLADGQAKAAKSKKLKGRGMDMTAVMTMTSDMDLLDFRRIP